jgi:hypothetical protein
MKQTLTVTVFGLLLGLLAGQTATAATPHAAARQELCAEAPRQTFTDISGVHANNVGCVVAFGVGRGTTETTFNPHGPLRRDHLATLLTNFLALATGATFDPPTSNPFDDVAQSIHADNIAIAAQHNLTNGVTATRFAPQRPVTRDQFASLLVNTLTAAGHLLPAATASTFTDLQTNVHATNIARLAQVGIVSGATSQRFDPHLPVTRQQAATLLINAAAELHLAELWQAGPLGQTVNSPGGATNPQATVTVTQLALNGVALAFDTANPAANDPLILTGTATATESTIVTVQARIDAGAWITATATSGAFATAEEPFRVVLQDVPDGTRELTVRAIDADGLSSTPVTITLNVTRPDAAVIITAVTDPVQNRIVITFDQPVSCADTPAARAAWQFTNQSLHQPVAGQASGAPNSINLLPDSPTTCALNYTTAGIRVSDFGTLSYTRPDPDDAVRTDNGQLAQTAAAKVIDGFAPTLASANIDSGTNNKAILLTFSEPMQCRSFGQSDFWIAVSGVANSFTIDAVTCSSSSTTITVLMAEFEFAAGMQVNVAIVTDIFDASGDNKAPAPVTATTVVT